MNTIIDKISNLCRTDFKFFLDKANVTGVGFGLKETNNLQTSIPCFKVMVESKVSLSSLALEDIVPKSYKGFPTDVIEVGIIKAFPFQTKLRPAEGGCSIGVVSRFIAGTLGCKTTGFLNSLDEPYILSNNHVISLENTVLKNTNIVQPSQGDGGSPSDVIATLYRSIPLRLTTQSETPVNFIDAALGLVSNPALINDEVYTIGKITDIAPPKIGLQVQKFGRTSSYTTGTITALNASLNITYTTGTAFFANQIVATAMSSAGDSGSVVLDMKNRVIGLLCAGSTSVTILNDITSVLTLLGITLP